MLWLKESSPRTTFVVVMSVSATLFSQLVMLRRYGSQLDIISDLVKTGFVIAATTAIASFLFWTLLFRFKPKESIGVLQGGMAGFLTALFIIPTPATLWHFKTNFRLELDKSVDELPLSLIKICGESILAGVHTFSLMPKPAIAALMLSICAGVVICFLKLPMGNEV